MGDNLALWYAQIWKDEFRPLHEKVRYLDFWDMTVAIENAYLHPPLSTVVEMLKVLFGYMCDH